MRSSLIVIFLLTGISYVAAQDRDSILLRMNEVKNNPDYLCYSCSMDDRDSSSMEAIAGLEKVMNDFLQGSGYRFLRSADHCPEEVIKLLVLKKSETYYRTLAYVSKSALARIESELSDDFENKGTKITIQKLKRQLSEVSTLEEWKVLTTADGVASIVQSGLVDPTVHIALRKAYILFVDKRGRLLEIRSPQGSDGIRLNVKTNEPCVPRTSPPETKERWWMIIDEPTN